MLKGGRGRKTQALYEGGGRDRRPERPKERWRIHNVFGG